MHAFSKLMPAFGDALTEEQTEAAFEHIHTYCSNKDWPRGELNLPPPLIATKAYPEDEMVLETGVDTEGPNQIDVQYVYEKRLGKRNEVEAIIPLLWKEVENETGDDQRESSAGDIGLGVKQVMFHSLEAGSIVTVGGEIFFRPGRIKKDLAEERPLLNHILR